MEGLEGWRERERETERERGLIRCHVCMVRKMVTAKQRAGLGRGGGEERG